MAKKSRVDNRGKVLSERRYGFRDPNPRPIIIVTEGEQTEKIYFEGIAKYISSNNDDSIAKKPKIRVFGVGKSGKRLVDEALAITSRSIPLYQECWIVFDKDENLDFDEAIGYAESLGFKVAWSNESFECWLYMHFKRHSAPWHRSEYESRLNAEFKSSGLSSDGYKKTSPAIGVLPITSGYLSKAVENAQRLEVQNSSEERYPSKMNPGTTVHHLILSLKPYIKELL